LHISYGSVGLGCVPLFDELAGLVVKTRRGRDGGTFGGLLEEAFPGSIFGGGVVTMCTQHVLGTRKSEGPVATVLRQRVEEAVAAAPLPDGPALGGVRPAHEREVVGDLARWGTRLSSDRYRPFALFPVPVEAGSGVYLPGVMWFDPMLPPDAAAVFPLSALPGWPTAPRAAVDRWYTRTELRSAESWKRLPGLLRNALAGVAPHPKPVFSWVGYGLGHGGYGGALFLACRGLVRAIWVCGASACVVVQRGRRTVGPRAYIWGSVWFVPWGIWQCRAPVLRAACAHVVLQRPCAYSRLGIAVASRSSQVVAVVGVPALPCSCRHLLSFSL